MTRSRSDLAQELGESVGALIGRDNWSAGGRLGRACGGLDPRDMGRLKVCVADHDSAQSRPAEVIQHMLAKCCSNGSDQPVTSRETRLPANVCCN